MAYDVSSIWTALGSALDLTAAIALVTLAIWLWPRRSRFGEAGAATVVAVVITAGWCLAIAVSHAPDIIGFLALVAESARNLAWLVVIYHLFASDGRHDSVAPIRPVIIVLAIVEMLHLGVDYGLSRVEMDESVASAFFDFNVMFRLLATVGGLVLAHNLYAGAPREQRSRLSWPAMGLSILWAFDLNLYTVTYLVADWPEKIAAFRGLAVLALAACIGIGAARNRDRLRLRPSRAFTFQTFSLLAIGIYLIAMVAITQWLSLSSGDFARLIELGFLTLASAVALIVLPSRRMRGWLKVMTAKHFFQHRYDYREEWLRFTRTIGNNGPGALPLAERVVQSVADLFDAPAGLLLTPAEQGELGVAARWNWREIEVPAVALSERAGAHFEQTGFITDLDDVRAGGEPDLPHALIPKWLIENESAWALIPLVHYERLVGLVVLARPQIVRKFDWEDFDLLRVIGQQLASYLAENASLEALAESSRFEDFHRRIAFVMHDIKNLASQFSLLARNAELHAEKAEFRADMLVTLRSSSEKLNALIARLSRYGSGGGDRLEPVDGRQVLAAVMERFGGNPQVVLAEAGDATVTANRHSLEQVLVHLVQNAIDASPAGSAVFLSFAVDGLNGRYDVVDSGSGMSADFIRNRLFKPFVSTKTGGFGIGALEARELVSAMRGRLEVESREGLGSRFTVRLPIAEAAELIQNMNSQNQKVA
jgi:putative PEP-CTERM system histidine kinase